ncbi:MAG: Zn-ribbon domain-containing OB-fold protein, partial [Candidatus Bathyarchaeia archaeon]
MISEKYFEVVSEDPMVVKGRIVMPYQYFIGKTASRFFREIRDNGRFLGTICERCNLTYVPPRNTCPRCFSVLERWNEVGPEGVLETWTVTEYPLKVHPVKEPIIYAVIKLDGASTGFVHIVGDVSPEELEIGMRLKPIFREKREGNIL